jgi:dTDP-glucose 4,6-dehydratase
MPNKFKPKNILITGGAGFIGSNFLNKFVPKYPNINFVNLDKLTYASNLNNLEFLPKNQEVFKNLKLKSDLDLSKKIAQNYQFVKGDICDLPFLQQLFEVQKFDSVIHFAAESNVDFSIKTPNLFVQTNVLGTQNLLFLAHKYKIKRFHHISTDEVYGELPLDKSKLFVESTPLNPNSPYSASKASSDLLVRSYIQTFGLDAIITRCSNNYGPHQDLSKLIPKFITNLLNNQKVGLYDKGQNVRDWLFVEDHIDAIWEVFMGAKKGSIYNIGGNTEKTNLQITQKLLNLTNKKDNLVQYLPDRLGHDLRYAIDSTKIKEELGWIPKYDFETGITKTFEFYKKQFEIKT